MPRTTRRRRSIATAMVLSIVITGAGHIYLGLWARGVSFLLLGLGSGGLAGLPQALFYLIVGQPEKIQIDMRFFVVWAVLHLYNIVDNFRRGRRLGRGRYISRRW